MHFLYSFLAVQCCIAPATFLLSNHGRNPYEQENASNKYNHYVTYMCKQDSLTSHFFFISSSVNHSKAESPRDHSRESCFKVYIASRRSWSQVTHCRLNVNDCSDDKREGDRANSRQRAESYRSCNRAKRRRDICNIMTYIYIYLCIYLLYQKKNNSNMSAAC